MDNVAFFALVAFEDEQHKIQRAVQQRCISDLPPGEVLVRVKYSSLNYKDALSASGHRGVTKHYPHTPGIDAAGTVVHSTAPCWAPGDKVLCTGYDLGMDTSGGFGQYIRVPGEWLVRKPANLTLLECMQLGTAGFTAGLSIFALQANGVTPKSGPILVTGATGGLGTLSIMILKKIGYEVVAVTGKSSEHALLTSLGADRILDRAEALKGHERPLLKAQWAGCIDTVGGNMLAAAIKSTNYEGVVTICGNAASSDLPLNVYPFILRGVHLIGIYSANCPMARRLLIWDKLANEWALPELSRICRMITLNQLDTEIQAMIDSKTKGRCVVNLEGMA
jgi:putative YhdH/YhfP family quinone oxidoreductase